MVTNNIEGTGGVYAGSISTSSAYGIYVSGDISSTNSATGIYVEGNITAYDNNGYNIYIDGKG